MALKKPQLVVQFAGQQTATSTPVNGGAWLQLSPDTMHQHRLHSQQLMLVSCVLLSLDTTNHTLQLFSSSCSHTLHHLPRLHAPQLLRTGWLVPPSRTAASHNAVLLNDPKQASKQVAWCTAAVSRSSNTQPLCTVTSAAAT